MLFRLSSLCVRLAQVPQESSLVDWPDHNGWRRVAQFYRLYFCPGHPDHATRRSERYHRANIRSAILATVFLKERLGIIGIIGCLLSLIGAVIIILHAPEDPQVDSVEELVSYMIQPGFLVYSVAVVVTTVIMIWKVVPRWGKKKVMVYVTICSLVGSLSVMAIKAFGIAVRLTIEGNNQFKQPSTYVFAFMCVVSILTQVNYFNKALDTFSTSLVNPIYFVSFTTATIVASAIMYHGWHTANAVNTVSLVCGFVIIFIGVYLLDSIARGNKHSAIHLHSVDSSGSLVQRHDSKSNVSLRSAGLSEKDKSAAFHSAKLQFQETTKRSSSSNNNNNNTDNSQHDSGSQRTQRRAHRALSV